ncbi:MFS transporter [Nocardioides sp. CER19]|uniref:MFS transporter n=1 Tax=Nocardioides sp. CER19 TaxID=3038538 RepID=UPI00244D59AB|nr:MFS transporter [Nocardioides sp. CER19]MDH2413282.1 MFS transporter [Nocardioides sp. CER19]
MSNPVDETARRAETANPHRWRILGVSLVIGFMALLDVSIVNLAVPSMQRALGASTGTIQWVVSGYALAFGLTLVAGGRLGDAYGRRRLMVLGLCGFTVASAAVGFAPTAGLVIAARLVQGATAGLLTPQNSGLIQQLFSGRERGRAFGVFGLTVSLSSATGPVLGGFILAVAGPENGWRYLFLINVPIGIVALGFVLRLVPRREDPAGADARIDVVGAVLLGLSVLAVLYPVVSIEGGAGWQVVLIVLAPLFGWGFVHWERRTVSRGHPPLLDVSLLRRVPGYAGGLAIGTLYFTGFTGLLLVTSYHLQDALGFGPFTAGLLIAPFAIGSAISAPLAGRVVNDVGRRITVGALATIIVGIALAAWLIPLPSREHLWLVSVPCLLLAGLGGGAVVSPNMTLTLAEVPPRMGGAAGGAMQTGQRVGASVGAALLMTVYSVASAHVVSGTALRLALLTGAVLLVGALAMAVRDWRSSTSVG